MSDKNHTQGEHGNGRVNPAHHGAPEGHGADKARIEQENEKWKQSQAEREKEHEEGEPEENTPLLPKKPEF